MNLNPAAEAIIRKLLEHDIPVELELREGVVCYGVRGFYKSGSAVLVPGESGLDGRPLFVAHTRYGQADDIFDFGDLVLLNREWLTRRKGYTPDSKWAPLLEEAGLIKKKVVETWEVK